MKSWYMRIPRRIRQLVLRHASYSLAVAFNRSLLGNPHGRRKALEHAAPLLRTLDNAGIVHDPVATARRVMMQERLFPWGCTRLSRCPEKEFRRWVCITGQEHLETALAQGRGVMLAGNHFGPGHLVNRVLCRQAYRVHILRKGRRKNAFESENSLRRELHLEDDDSPGYLDTMITIRDLLRQGEIVHVALDGSSGGGGLRLQHLGLYREFRTGLPLIAYLSNAIIIPVFVNLKENGKIAIDFDRPFADPDPEQSPVSYAEFVVRDYVDRLNAFCRAEPGSVKIKRINKLEKANARAVSSSI